MKTLKELREKAVSQAQQKMMGMALAYKRGEMDDASPEVKKMADSMSMKDLEDFAKTKHKGLPDKKESRKYRAPTAAEIEADKKKDKKGNRPSISHKSATKKVYGNMMGGLKKESVELEEAAPKLKGNNGPYTRQQIEKAAKEAKVDLGAKSRMMMALRDMK